MRYASTSLLPYATPCNVEGKEKTKTGTMIFHSATFFCVSIVFRIFKHLPNYIRMIEIIVS